MRKLNIAYVCTEKLPSPAVKGGAIQMMIDGVVPYLIETHSMTVFSVQDPELPDYEEVESVTYIRVPRENYSQNIADELADMDPFDLIHVFNRPKAVPLYKSVMPESEIVLSLHNDMFTERKLSDEEGLKAIECASEIMTVSNYIKGAILNRFPEADRKIQVVYSGVDLTQFHPSWTEEGKKIKQRLRRKYSLSNRKVILFIGRLSKTKGPHLLIKAMPSILEEHPDAVLVICGGKWFSDNRMNEYVSYLYKLAKPLGDHVLFTKYIPHEEIPNTFLLGDVFVCSSQWQEPLARVHYEAMAAGVPLITTKRGGNAEVVTHMHNGLVIGAYRRPSSFSRAICDVLNHPERASEMSLNGRKVVEANHTFRHVADRLERVYNKAFDGIPKLSSEPEHRTLEAEVLTTEVEEEEKQSVPTPDTGTTNTEPKQEPEPPWIFNRSNRNKKR
ncbi:glycosyltransferase family 4 protein [Guptibacillus algicola]|uniref:glycosyltransferase family 4 protein n=1 Tax=Guptibacillus algicola TaxID=225844 RepID=UPI001CD22792|nr:glycosyltransferase family 4 protein [Alkalihalobacillus algicola]MCA0987845.1 glycosyltransferase family 4 protein [Alkalihalobacillus algicola]